MEKVAIGCLACVAASLACPVLAQDAGKEQAEVRVAQAQGDPSLRLKMQATALPRLDTQEGALQSPRVDLSVMPFDRSGRALGAVVGITGPSSGPPALGLQPRSNIDLGLRWSQRLQSARQIDITAWRRMNAPDDAYTLAEMRNPVYGARVEMNLTRPHSGLSVEKGFLGFQMESGARISVKRKDGVPMVYYRTGF
jgi:hypothetical protein